GGASRRGWRPEIERQGILRLVGALELRGLLGRERESHRLDGILEVMGLGGADDRGGYVGLGEQPGDAPLRPATSALTRYSRYCVDHRFIGLSVESVSGHGRVRANGARPAARGQQSAPDGAVGDEPDALLAAQGNHLAL